jgi:hypothetical protein
LNTKELIDSPKATMNNNSARALSHNQWFIQTVLPAVFGYTIVNSDGREVDVVDIGSLHVLEDFRHKFIPTAQDYLKHLVIQPWMNNAVKPIDNEQAYNEAETFKQKLEDGQE